LVRLTSGKKSSVIDINWKKSLEVPMNGFASAVNHTTTDQLAGDQIEQDEWRDALASLVANAGPARQQPAFPGDLAIEERLAS
jgi:pyruvate dehydrogenase E1 component